jgi:hypothetical protein
MSERKHGSQLSQLVDYDDAIANPDLLVAAREACDTALVKECQDALYAIGRKHGLEACDEDWCMFPHCLAEGCEAEPVAAPPVKEGM